MSDHELLQLAAKAVGITLDFTIRGDYPPYYVNERGGHSSWNPLTDDGDALRLAVKIQKQIQFSETSGGPTWVRVWKFLENGFTPVVEHVGTGCDPMAATRRAIVRAAAEIGNEMQ